jgi:hypothetical protein
LQWHSSIWSGWYLGDTVPNMKTAYALFIHWKTWNNFCFEVEKHLHKEKLWAEASLVGCKAWSHLCTVHSKWVLNSIGLFQAIFDCLIGQPIGAPCSPLVIPVELGQVVLNKVEMKILWLALWIFSNCSTVGVRRHPQ